MESLEIIKTAYSVDRQLGELAAAVTDEQLRERIFAMQAGWREIAYAVGAEACGVGPTASTASTRRRGRRKRGEFPAGGDEAPKRHAGSLGEPEDTKDP